MSGHTFRFHWTVQDSEVFLVISQILGVGGNFVWKSFLSSVTFPNKDEDVALIINTNSPF